MDPMVALDGIGVTINSRPILDDVQLTVEAGNAALVTGPNGSGKTTLLRLIATLLRPSAGSGTVAGVDLSSRSVRQLRGSIGFVTHAPALIAPLTLRENLEHFGRLAGESLEVDRLLDVVGLGQAGYRRASECSFGMMRRTEIAWLLAAKPEVLLLDEAQSGLDVPARQLISAVVQNTLERNGAVVAVSHDVSDLGHSFADRYRLENGRLEKT